MPTLFIANTLVVVPARFVEGSVLDEVSAAILNDIHIRRLRARIAYLLQRGELGPEEVQAKAFAIAQEDLAPGIKEADDDLPDPIYSEAVGIACDLILRKMREQGLPEPKHIAEHAKALVEGNPAFEEQARKRLEARHRAAMEALGITS